MEAEELAEHILEHAPQVETELGLAYVVERDILLQEADVLAYAQQACCAPPGDGVVAPAPDDLVAAMWDGKPVRWEAGTVLGWKVDRESFHAADPDPAKAKAMADQVEAWMAAASADWNGALQDKGIDLRFEPSGEPLFTLRFELFNNASLYALAFFPHENHEQRIVRVGLPVFRKPHYFDPEGVLRHELGHVLGFRHEHVRENAPWPTEDRIIGRMDGLDLGAYDPKSAMHYPMGEAGTRDFHLTDLDRAGLERLYTLPTDQVAEYSA